MYACNSGLQNLSTAPRSACKLSLLLWEIRVSHYIFRSMAASRYGMQLCSNCKARPRRSDKRQCEICKPLKSWAPNWLGTVPRIIVLPEDFVCLDSDLVDDAILPHPSLQLQYEGCFTVAYTECHWTSVSSVSNHLSAGGVISFKNLVPTAYRLRSHEFSKPAYWDSIQI